jgi:transposase
MAVLDADHFSETNSGMQVKTILNRIQKQRGFVYGAVQLEEQIGGLAITVAITPHRRNRPQCSGCGQRGGVYDRLAPRRFEFVPLWGLRVFFLYMMRRVACPTCGVTVEHVPWADGLLRFFRWFGKERTAVLTFICSDMWKPYLKVVAKKAGHALHILDRFHIAKHMSDAIDRVRRAEVHSLRQ